MINSQPRDRRKSRSRVQCARNGRGVRSAWDVSALACGVGQTSQARSAISFCISCWVRTSPFLCAFPCDPRKPASSHAGSSLTRPCADRWEMSKDTQVRAELVGSVTACSKRCQVSAGSQVQVIRSWELKSLSAAPGVRGGAGFVLLQDSCIPGPKWQANKSPV